MAPDRISVGFWQDGATTFKVEVRPTALLSNAAMMQRITEHPSLSEAKEVCDQIADQILAEAA